MSRSIYWKITIPFALLILVVMSVLGIYVVNTVQQTQTIELENQLTNEARLVAEISHAGFATADNGKLLDNIAKTTGKEIGSRVTLIGKDGTVLGDTDEDPTTLENHATRPEVKTALAGGTGQEIRYSATLRQNMMYVAVPVMEQDQISGVARVALPMTEVDSLVNKTVTTIVVAIIIATICVILITALISRMITRPVRQLTTAATGISAGKLTQKVRVKTDDEIGKLGQVFNQMSANLQQSMNQISSEKLKLQTVLSNMADGVVMVDGEGTIILANRTSGKIFGFKEQEATGRPFIEAVKDHAIDAALKSCVENHQTETVQLESGKTKKFIRTIAVPLGDGSQTGALILFQDLTELRSLQTMRRELVGNISHDLRTPLAGIKVMVETLKSDAIDDKATAQDFLSRIDKEVDRMTQMVAELTELSRIETGKADLNMSPVNMNILAKEVITQLNTLAEREQVKITANLKENLPLVTADRERIRQTLVNLIHNAIKFNHPGGKVIISTNADTESVMVSVTDTGTGIAKEEIPHVFERFYKSDKARSKGGSGLGLAIAKHTVQVHGGNIQVQSEEGKGSTFTFNLPFKNNSNTQIS
jgi:two-component system, OmpR family, phosphate regulon sensor histidine kinase PhoR